MDRERGIGGVCIDEHSLRIGSQTAKRIHVSPKARTRNTASESSTNRTEKTQSQQYRRVVRKDPAGPRRVAKDALCKEWAECHPQLLNDRPVCFRARVEGHGTIRRRV